MKSIAATLACLAAIATPALGATPLDGAWYFECGADIPDTDNKTVIADDRIVTGDVICDIKEVKRIGGEGQVWRLTNSCIEKGEAWIEDVIFGFEVDYDGKVLRLVEIGMDDGYALTYLACKDTSPNDDQ
ncbi:hypothetical protein [Bauldia litoralis]|uniref:hypothetical protein n=1 Tax=Bauldia litoralis TaxID=665467 RepID=UPI003263F526